MTRDELERRIELVVNAAFDFVAADAQSLKQFAAQVSHRMNKSAILAEYDRLKAIEDAQRWIPVGERLPEDNKDVLVTGSKHAGTQVAAYYSRTGEFEMIDESIIRPTHWRPLPEAPEVTA